LLVRRQESFGLEVDEVCSFKICFELAGVAQLARASAFQAEGRGFESRFPLHFQAAHIAQAVEHFLGKEEVIGSSPIVGSIQQFSQGKIDSKSVIAGGTPNGKGKI
jgi:hypothetical protein